MGSQRVGHEWVTELNWTEVYNGAWHVSVWKWKWKSFSRVWLLYSPWNSLGQNTGVGGLSLLQGIFPTQGSNPGPPHCRQILYQLSHKESPRRLEWVAYPFSSRYSQPRNWTGVSSIAGGFFFLPTELSGKPSCKCYYSISKHKLPLLWRAQYCLDCSVVCCCNVEFLKVTCFLTRMVVTLPITIGTSWCVICNL